MLEWLLAILLIFIGGTLTSQPVAKQDALKTKLSPAMAIHLDKVSESEKIHTQLFLSDTILFSFPEKIPLLFRSLKFSNDRVFIVKVLIYKKQIPELLQDPNILFVELVRTPDVEFKQEGLDLTLNEITYLQHELPDIAGTDMHICIKENLFDTNDIDFTGRIGTLELASPIVDMHATNMATISAGGGNSSHTAKGAAWNAYISSSDFINLLPDPDNHFVDHLISVQNHAYGTGIENYYGMETAFYDQATNRLPWLIHVFSSGNIGDQSPTDGTYAGLPATANLTGQFKQSKNTITVGATDSIDLVLTLSSRGPAYDGRIKPEVVAYGHGGSSGAAAIVSGISILIQEAFFKNFDKLPPSSLVKASLINTTHDIEEKGPDYKSGYGSVNAFEAVMTILNNRFAIQSLSKGESLSMPFVIPEDIYAADFTIAWNDPAASILSDKALINDINIELENITTGQRWFPWLLNSFPHGDSLHLPAIRGIDSINNVEKITIDLPSAGNYLLHVTRADAHDDAQEFSLVWLFEAENNLQWTFPTKSDHLVPGKNNFLRWNSSLSENGLIEFKMIGGEWITIQNDVNPHGGFAEWNAPDQSGLAQLRWSGQNGDFLSDTFLIVNPLEPKVALLCADSLVINWNDPGSSDSFEILRLGSRHLEHYTYVTDTFFIEYNPDLANKYYAVAPVYRDFKGPVSYAFDYTLQGAGCFLNIFYLRHVIEDKAFFGAELSAIGEIASVELEEKINDTFQVIQVYSQVDTNTLFFESGNLKQGVNEFRLKLVLKNGAVIYSQIEKVYFTGNSSVLIFPNPVASGTELQILTKGIDDFALNIFDIQGREIAQFQHLESPVLLPGINLQPGIFIVQIISGEGVIHSGIIHVYK